MDMNRRTVMTAGVAASMFAMLPRGAMAAFSPAPDGWHKFEITTRIALPATTEAAQIWVPLPAVDEAGWMTPGATDWTTNADRAEIVTNPDNGVAMLHAEWDAGTSDKVLDLVNTISAQGRDTDLTQPGQTPELSAQERTLYTSATALIPTDGLVKETSDKITAGADSDLEKARLIYDWIVENTARNPETRGCGLGDVASMLAVGDLTGKCADLNSLYVGLARAAGLPSRDVYGLRVAKSAFGYKSLGAGSPDVTKAQHCRAEVFLDGFGWVAVDPADVRKVMLEEPPKDLALDDPKVVDARAALFGGWEGNWIAYNFAHDVVLPGSDNGAVEFLMYPQAEVAGERFDPLDMDRRYYTITARELTA
ncbi:transglutaminase-like domain-containing protein [Puniceibacterium sediminis]|uniref:Transglutaminase-like superfamily protein n=1 Tax=Puniceibacterium sediminis TaxID=1608407 RepID=A0A238US62_9RHOB|nr:transglutaminase-like domain-containing protein [Puniceibacterium sediminis]SNR24761.1 Transglutaminase-like superfamily protein [Puniceibacterium sediminis]